MGSAAPPNRLSPWFGLRSSDRLSQPVLALPRLGSTMLPAGAAPLTKASFRRCSIDPAVLRHCPTLPQTAPRVTSDRLLPRKPDHSPDRKRPANGNAPARHKTETCLASETQYAPQDPSESPSQVLRRTMPAGAAGLTAPDRAVRLLMLAVPTASDGAPPTVLAATLAKWCDLNGTVAS